MKVHRLWILALPTLMAVAEIDLSDVASACPCGGFCCHYPITLANQLANASVILLADRVSGDEQVKQTTFVVRHFEGDESGELNVGDSISIPYFSKDDPPGLHLLLGGKNEAGPLYWQRVGTATEARLKYILEAPRPDVVASQRLPYFFQYLESTDVLIAADAFLELDSAEWQDFLVCTSQLPRDKLRAWLRDPETPLNRLGLYAKLLGICGNRSDVEFLLAHIRQPTNDFRLELEGYAIAYLWRTGEKGLAVLDERRLQSANIPFSERYAVMNAIRFMMVHGSERVSRDRACESMRLLLDEPDLADLVIGDLARWKDWSVQDQVMRLYGEGEYNNTSIKRAIVRYLFASAGITTPISGDPKKLAAEFPNSKRSPRVLQARTHLERLCEQDLKTVQQVERFMLVK